MRRILVAICFLTVSAGGAFAEGPVPERRLALIPNVDFPGGDLAAYFDTTLEACRAICLGDAACGGFTFNERSLACFPKATLGAATPFDGALSGRVSATDPRVLAQSVARQSELSFLEAYDFAESRSLAQAMPTRHRAGQWSAAQLSDAASEARTGGNLMGAFRLTGAAISVSDAPELWLDYARDARAIAANDANQRYEMGQTAVLAAINGYLRGLSPQIRASAAHELGLALEGRGRGREMIAALRLAQVQSPRADTATTLERALATYGFRIIDQQVQSEAAAPRICAVFSEPLADLGIDYRSFVGLPRQDLAVVAEGRLLCVTGVEHGARYRLSLRQGLPSASGETLRATQDLTLYVPDRSASVRFIGQSYVLPRSQGASVPLVTVNADEVALRLSQVSDRNILRSLQEGLFGSEVEPWQQERFEAEIAEEIWTGTGEVEAVLNQDVTTQMPLGEVLARAPAGLYVLEAQVADGGSASQWFILSDLGLSTMTGQDGVHVVVRGLGDAEPRDAVDVTLISEGNRVLATAQSDAAGYVHFAPGLTRGVGAAQPGLIVARLGDDFAFLSLRSAAFDLSDRGVEGRPAAPPVDVFLATDRGAYRPGEAIHLTALARDGLGAGLVGAPLIAVLTRADGVEYSRHVLDSSAAGGAVAALPIGADVPRGTWRLAIFGDPDAPALAQTTVLVEDFTPERLEMAISLPDLLPQSGGAAQIQVDYLFGTPGADLPVSATLNLQSGRSLAAWPGYGFGRHDAERPSTGSALETVQTDATGAARLALFVPQVQTDLPQSLRLTAQVSEGSGRPIERSAQAPVARKTTLIGIRPLEQNLPEGGTAQFDVIAVGADDTLQEMAVSWTLNRVEQRYQWFLQNGAWSWDPVTTRSPVAAGQGRLGQAPLRIETAVDWGQYELAVVREGGGFLAASETISAGWFAPADTIGTPDVLELSLDAPRYQSGDTATLRVVPRAPGLAQVAVISDRLIHMETVRLSGAPQEIPLRVTDDWGTGAYVTVQAIRPVAEAQGRIPTRSLGLAHAAVDPGAKALAATLETAPQSAPRGPLRATLRVPGATGPVYASVAAVDLGILNLTGFQSPDPQGHYFGQRRLGMDLRDLYGRLIDPTLGALGLVRSGGDAGASMRAEAAPPTETPVILHSGLITLDADGRADLSFDIPDFNGTVRLMALVWSETGVGQATQDVLVRDPVVTLASLPRFLSPGDSSILRLELVHASGPEGRLSLDIDTDPGLSLGTYPSGIPIAAGAPARLEIPVAAEAEGLHRLRLRMTAPDGTLLTKTLTLDVRRLDPPIVRTELRSLAPGETLRLGDVIAPDLSGQRLTLTSGTLARFDAAGLLMALEHYPYGCTEQVIARALPLLSLAGVAQALELSDADSARARIDASIDTVLSRQLGAGGFGLWNSEDNAPWLDAMATDFLAQARKAGHLVPDLAFERALDNLRNRVNTVGDFEQGGEDIAYALLVLARQGAAAMGDLRYYADVKAEAFGSPFAVAQLGAALAAYGDQTRADRLMARAAERVRTPDNSALMRADFGTQRRDAAGIIALANGAGSRAVAIDALAELTRAPAAPSTQESLWMLLAAASDGIAPLENLTLEGVPLSGPLVQLEAQDAALSNIGTAPQLLSLTITGLPTGPQTATAEGYRIERFYFDLEGAPLDPANVAQGTRMVAVLKVLPLAAREARLMVADPLPAGFEIDNPTLLRGGDIRALDWLELTDWTTHTEFRADRFLAAIDWTSGAPFQLAYILRAVSPGDFHHPAASVEDMYRPGFRATTDAGRVRVR